MLCPYGSINKDCIKIPTSTVFRGTQLLNVELSNFICLILLQKFYKQPQYCNLLQNTNDNADKQNSQFYTVRISAGKFKINYEYLAQDQFPKPEQELKDVVFKPLLYRKDKFPFEAKNDLMNM